MQAKRGNACLYLIEDVRDILLTARLFRIAEFRDIFAGQQALVPHQGHALVRHLVALKMYLVIRTTYTHTHTQVLRPLVEY